MGFFGKLKDNLTGGGVKIKLDTPPSVSTNDQSFNITIHIENTDDEPRTIDHMSIELYGEETERRGTSSTHSTRKIRILSQELNDAFTLQPTESKDIPVNVIMSIDEALKQGGIAGDDNPVTSMLGTAAKALGASRDYGDRQYVQVTAHVNDITFNPSEKNRISVNRPGEMGGSWSI